MKYTSSEANKLLRRLNEERDAVLVKEQKSRSEEHTSELQSQR